MRNKEPQSNWMQPIPVSRKHRLPAVDILDFGGSWLMQSLPTLEPFLEFSKEATKLSFTISLPPLIPGTYTVGVWIGENLRTTLAAEREVVSFTVETSPTRGRTEPHNSSRGYIVPHTDVEIDGRRLGIGDSM